MYLSSGDFFYIIFLKQTILKTWINNAKARQLGVAVSKSALSKNCDSKICVFENTIFKSTIKRLGNICLKLMFWLKLPKRTYYVVILKYIKY